MSKPSHFPSSVSRGSRPSHQRSAHQRSAHQRSARQRSAHQRSALLLLLLTFACGRAPRTGAEPEARNVQLAGAAAPLAYGDCAEAERRLAADPEMPVDRVPAPLAMKPAPFQKVPPGAWKKDGSAVIKVEVMVDTTGRADMTTFRPVTVSHPWFAQNLRTVIPRWRFAPATVAGCKVRRVYRFSATVPPRTERAKAAARRSASRQAAGSP